MKLTVDLVCDLANGVDIRQLKKLSATHMSITVLDDISPCLELHRLDLSHNQLRGISGLLYCTSLTWLNLSHNNLGSLSGIRHLTGLVVLNASHNSISLCGEVGHLKNLKALILNNNELTTFTCDGSLQQLNTLVLSHNHIEAIQISSLSNLTKLSLAHNQLREIPDTKNNTDLRELRLNGNKITSLPSCLIHNLRLQVLDVGGNRITSWSSLSVLKSLAVRSLNLKGNIVSTSEDYHCKVQELLPSLSVLDGHKVGTTSLKSTIQAHSSTAEVKETSRTSDTNFQSKIVKAKKRSLSQRSRISSNRRQRFIDVQEEKGGDQEEEEEDGNEVEKSKKLRLCESSDTGAIRDNQSDSDVVIDKERTEATEQGNAAESPLCFPAVVHDQRRELQDHKVEKRQHGILKKGKSGVVALKTISRKRTGQVSSSHKHFTSKRRDQELEAVLYGKESRYGAVAWS